MYFKDLIYLPIDMTPPPDISEYLDTITEDNESFVKDTYRISPSIVFMTPDGEWMDVAYGAPEFMEWAEETLFPWAGMRSQTVFIVTPEGKQMAPHIDCAPHSFNDWQHKFRYVMRGNVSDLRYFDGDEYVTPTDAGQPYIIDGSWPHDMANTYPGTKYTLCFGHPWNPQGEEDYLLKLRQSLNKYENYYISSENMTLPENYKDYFNHDKYPKQS